MRLTSRYIAYVKARLLKETVIVRHNSRLIPTKHNLNVELFIDILYIGMTNALRDMHCQALQIG